MSKICIDGYNIALPRGTGIATYGKALLEANKARGATCEILFGPAATRSASNLVNEAALVEPASAPARLKRLQRLRRDVDTATSRFGRTAWPIKATHQVRWRDRADPPADQFWSAPHLYNRANRCFKHYNTLTPLLFEKSEKPPSVMHWTMPLPIWARNVPNIYTIHDLIPLTAPFTTLNNRAEYMTLHKKIIRHADQFAVISQKTKEDLISIFGVHEDRITTTYQSVYIPDSVLDTKDSDVCEEIRSTFNLDWKSYFIHFGAIEPKKNLGRIVEAYLSTGSQSPLVVVGSRGWLDEDETALINQIKRIGGASAERIYLYEYMSRRMLLNLIRGAKATFFPSLYEGFGLPILESMALGTPTLTSKDGATAEVAGEAALLVDPYDVDSIASGMRALDADTDLLTALSERGKARAKVFNAQAYAERLDTLYARVA